MWHRAFFCGSIITSFILIAISFIWPKALYLFILVIPIILLGIYDIFSRNNVLYNYPVIGHIRYMMEFVSPEIRQYFLEDDESGRPYNRLQRELVYTRGNGEEGIHPFGTENDIKAVGYDFIVHTIGVKVALGVDRVIIGGPQCKLTYSSSRLNISAMSFGALSSYAVLAMNKGAKLGNFFQDTGEGGLTSYHLKYKADLVWEIGSGYFGCRQPSGRFNEQEFQRKANYNEVKMIAIKISQGAKPGSGGLLPAVKVTPEIANFRGVPVGKDCISPAFHPEFSTPKGLLEFVQRLRYLCGGKPVGFKLCIGRHSDFLGICKAMLTSGILPDFITVDGAEGGTGAAHSEVSDYVGLSIDEALPFVHSSLIGCNLRDKIRVIASGKIVDGFDILKKIALGADVCNVARPMMFAVGCIQALRCHTGNCPTGVTTQNLRRARAINIDDKAIQVKNYHHITMSSFLQLLGVLGLEHPDKLRPDLILHRTNTQEVKNYAELYNYLTPGALLTNQVPASFAKAWQEASADYFNL